MKVLYTSYFGRLKQLQKRIAEEQLTPISIARITPGAIKVPQRIDLAPPSNLLRRYKDGKCSKEECERIYLQHLNQWKAEYISNSLPDKAILCCYEKPQDFCHRHILAKWLKDYCEIKEI